MDVAVDGPDLWTEHALERHRLRRDDRDVDAALAGRGRDLGADPARADDREPAAGVYALADRVRVRELAEVEDALEVDARDVQAPRLGTGGEEQAVVVDPLATREHDLGGGDVDALRGHAGAQLDLLFRVERLLVHVGLVARRLAAQVILRQRRSFVGTLLLGADEQHAAVEPLLAEGLGGLRAGQAGADDHECLVGGHTQLLLRTDPPTDQPPCISGSAG